MDLPEVQIWTLDTQKSSGIDRKSSNLALGGRIWPNPGISAEIVILGVLVRVLAIWGSKKGVFWGYLDGVRDAKPPKTRVPGLNFHFSDLEIVFCQNGHLADSGWTFGPSGPKGIRKKKTRRKKGLLRGQEVRILGSGKKEPRTARGHFETGSRIKWSIGAPQMGPQKKPFF